MLVSYKWLSEYVDLAEWTPKALADKMSVTGIEVEGTETPEEGLKKIVVGEVMECVPHPNSDHLSICQVDIGEPELSQIVCGAPNVKKGIKVIVALPGARIAGNVKIKKGKMRGEVSNGMICALQELGYSDSVVPKAYAEGIYYMPMDAEIGASVFPYLEMDDTIIELSITPNRADALSMRGVAYEVAAITNQKPHFPEWTLVEDTTDWAENYLTVSVEDTEDTPTYRIRIIKDVKIGESPLWLQTRLMNEGIRPINNVVDITNYILLEYGQPLHAFDYDKLGSKEIVVRRGKLDETLVTLDGEERTVAPENLVITNGTTPVALAGVMGGLDSEITEATTTVALESALFEASLIRKTSRQFGLRSESSSRFEKGINRGTVAEAGDAAAQMMAELAGGTVVEGTVIGSEFIPENAVVTISLAKINRSLGTELTEAEVLAIMEALAFPTFVENGTFTVSVPPRRWDISIEADIIEEVARIYGYDRLPSTLPAGETVAASLTQEQRFVRQTQAVLEGSGFSEAISYALTTAEKASQFLLAPSKETQLDWPMSEERTTLRMNLITGLLDDVAYNVARKNQDIAFYEIGRVFYQQGNPLKDLPEERNHLGLVLTGSWQEKDWQTAKTAVDFYQLKGVLENYFAQISLTDVRYEPLTEVAELHPGRSAKILSGETVIGFIGQVHPTLAKTYDLGETYVAELDLKTILALPEAPLVYQSVSKFPSVSRDMALLVDDTISNQELVTIIKESAGRFLTNVHLFDVYQGERVEAGKKSMAYSLTFSNPEATLVDEEIAQWMEKVTKALTAQGVQIR